MKQDTRQIIIDEFKARRWGKRKSVDDVVFSLKTYAKVKLSESTVRRHLWEMVDEGLMDYGGRTAGKYRSVIFWLKDNVDN